MKDSLNLARIRALTSVLFVLLAFSANIFAAEFVVDRNDDLASASACTAVADDCSLRGAIASAAAAASDDSIVFDPIVFGTDGRILLNGTVLSIAPNGALVIDGSAARFVTVDGQMLSRVFFIQSGADVTLRHVSIKGGNSGLQGGGAIENRGLLRFSYATLSENRGGSGGAIYNFSATLFLSNATVCSNQSAYGAVHNVGSTATTTIADTTICNNSAIYGGGIYRSSGTVNLSNTIVANNSASTGGPDVWGTVVSGGFNLFGNSSGMTISGAGTDDVVNADAMLDPAGLADNGGNSLTVALLPGSPAIDNGNSGSMDDQRNNPRPIDDPDTVDGNGNGSDIGAFEYQPIVEDPPPPPPPPPGPTFDFGGFGAPLNGDGLNSVRAGAVAPVKFSLGGFHGYAIFAPGFPASVEISCDTGTESGMSLPVIMPGGSGLDYNSDSDTYSFRWRTERSWSGTCRRLQVGLTDGTVQTADFRFR